ncbi:hypothetical protein K4L44_09640 [Halosquirtibacter laminarini]|uniref:Uncharacterized protein n=1 Tax=Halosquirtibacter laminarini TaxID=3374600 RepID=A0AC61NQT0_9BACT|nr:hypothetical protein K4L44_09640 [Prolixibacteraceae bacterium]
MKIRLKIFSGFIIMALLMVAAGAISGIEFSKIGVSINRILSQNNTKIKASNQMLTSLEKQNEGILLILQGQWSVGYEDFEQGGDSFLEALNIVKKDTISKVERQSVENLAIFIDDLNMMKDSTLFNRKIATLEWYYQNPYPLLTKMTHEVIKIQKYNQNALFKTSTGLKERAKRAIVPGVVVVVALLLFISVFSYLVNHFFVEPIIRINDRANDNLRYGRPFDVNIQTNDELRKLAEVIKKLTNKNQ